MFYSSCLILLLATSFNSISFGNETFDPGADSIFFLEIDAKKKKISNGCEKEWFAPNHLVSRVGQAKSGKRVEFDADHFKVVKSTEFCQWAVLKKSPTGSEPRVECKDSISTENKKIVILKFNKDLDGKTFHAIVAGKDVCIKFLREKLLEGYQLYN